MLFYLFAAALVVLTLVFLLPPLLRRSQASAGDDRQRAANLTVLRGQMAELEQERREGLLAEADFEQAKRELQRRLLEEVEPAAAAGAAGNAQASRLPAFALLILVPVLAALGYWTLGTPKALDPLATSKASDITPEQIDKMVAGLAARLEANPDDTRGWIMLAKSYKALGRAQDAVNAYGKVESAIADNPELLVDYADALAMLSGGDLAGKPTALVNQALQLDPNNLFALWLAGTAAFDRKEFPGAVAYWERALALLPPESEDRQILVKEIANAKQKSALKADPARAVSGKLELAPALKGQVAPDDTVFVFARAVDGPRFPLAAAKLRVADLPADFVLDDSLSMIAGQQISSHAEVIVEARISRSGNAVAKDGDLQSKPQTVRVGEKKLKLVVDHAFSSAK